MSHLEAVAETRRQLVSSLRLWLLLLLLLLLQQLLLLLLPPLPPLLLLCLSDRSAVRL